MTDTMQAPETAPTRQVTLERQVRTLRIPLFILAALVLAMGAWIIYDLVQDSTFAPTSEINELVDDYMAAWNEYDGDAFLATTREGYTFRSNMTGTFDRDEQLFAIEYTLPSLGWQAEMVGDPIVVGGAPWYYVSVPVQRESTLGGVNQGMCVLEVYQTDGGELLVTKHIYTGR